MSAFDSFGLPVVPGLTQDQIRNGFRLFFSNKPHEAMEFFSKHPDVPLFAMGKAAVMFAHALVSFEDEDIENAVNALHTASVLALFHSG
jgi:hypothetical protein